LFGQWGETRASQYVQKLGYTVLAQNLHLGKSELDLVALDPHQDELVIIEVKTRRNGLSGHPSQSVRGKKWLALHRAGAFLLQTWNFSKPLRFDIISLSPNGLEHFQNVTWP
jgi:putative endonuclease